MRSNQPIPYFMPLPASLQQEREIAQWQKEPQDPALENLIQQIEDKAKDPLVIQKLDFPLPPYVQAIIQFMTSFIPIDDATRKRIKPTFSPHVILIHSVQDHPRLAKIKINFAGLTIGGNLHNAPIISVSYKSQKVKAHFISCGNFRDVIRDAFTDTIQTRVGYELYAMKRFIQASDSNSKTWNTPQWDKLPMLKIRFGELKLSPLTAFDTYDIALDPIMLKHFLSAAKSLQKTLKPGQPLTLLDMGAGKGRLAKKIIAVAHANHIPLQYLFLEPSIAQIEIAMPYLTESANLENINIRFINKTIEKFKPEEPVHLVISSGGPICKCIASRKQALQRIDLLHTALADNGIMIALGATNMMVKSEHFKERGWDVLSYVDAIDLSLKDKDPAILQAILEQNAVFGKISCYVTQKKPPPVADTKHYFTSLRDILAKQTYSPLLWDTRAKLNHEVEQELEALEKATPAKLPLYQA